jgi:histidinol phosphatase-like enzyme (inositol monophosphatase family)
MTRDAERLARLAALAERAADRARAEILPRFRTVGFETKADGSPVTEADRAAERAVRAVLREGDPGAALLGEELGAEGDGGGDVWVIDPIDGTIAFTRGIPLFGTILARLEGGVPVVGLIDLPALGERYVGWKGSGCRRNGVPVRCSRAEDLRHALVSHGDAFCFEAVGEHAAFVRMAAEIPMLRGYTDAFGHARVLDGGVDAMVDLHLNPWDAAATQLLVPEAGGRCETLRYPESGKLGLVFGAPALVEALVAMLARPPAPREAGGGRR